MKFETLKSFNKKKLIIPTVIISCLVIVITIFVSHSKYVYKDSITIMDDEVNYKPYDFKIIGIYQQKEECENPSSEDCYEKKDVIPTKGFKINQDKTYCYIDDENEKITNKIFTNEQGQHVIGDLSIRSKCYLYFDQTKEATPKDTFDQLAKLGNLMTGGEIDQNGFGTPETASSTRKVYETKDNDGTSYYYRGDVQDNYVKFGKTGTDPNSGEDIWWRIIRINGDGSIRMIYAGTGSTVPNQKTSATNIIVDNKTTFFYGAENGQHNNNMYVGYQYTSGVRNGHSVDSYAKTEIEKWFAENLNDEFIAEDSKIDRNAGFCVDRQAYSDSKMTVLANETHGTATQVTYYGSRQRNYPNETGISLNNPAHPSLRCPDVTNDLLTYKESKKGTKSLLYPIGLITADEVVYAGGLWGASNTNYYLYNNTYYWTMSPYDFDGTYARVFNMYISGALDVRPVTNTLGLRPVLNLISGALKSGTGVVSDPYKVS